MRIRGLKYSAIAFLFLGLLIFPSHSRAAETTGEKTDLKTEQTSGPKTDGKTDLKIEEKSGQKTDDKSNLNPEQKPAQETEGKPGPKSDGQSTPKTEAKPAKKYDGPFAFGKRWDTDTYIELDVVFDRYWGSFNQVLKGNPTGVRLRRGGDWKYVAFHFDLAGGYASSLKSSKVKINDGNLGFANMEFRLNGVLPVLYGVMLQAGIMDETWGEFAEYKTPTQKEDNIYIVNGLGPNVMLSFCPIKYVSLNFEYSAILIPAVSKHFYGNSNLNDDPDIEDYSVSDSSYSTVEAGITARPLKYLAIGVAYGEKKMSHQAKYTDKDHPQNNRAAKFKSLNDYIILNFAFTY